MIDMTEIDEKIAEWRQKQRRFDRVMRWVLFVSVASNVAVLALTVNLVLHHTGAR